KKLLASKALEKAVELDEKGQIDDAVKMLLEGMGHAPKDKKLNYAIAEMLINNKQFKDAFDTLNEMPLEDQDVMKLALIGYCMEGMERYDEAEEYADRALSLDPASALALNLKGILAFRKGNKATAEDFFKRAIDSDPGYGEPYTNLGTMKWDKKEEEAFSLYEKGFILSPTIMDVVTIYHSAVIALGKFERAEQLFRDANALHPHNKKLRYLLIDILVKQGKHDIAMNEIEEAIIKFDTDDGILSAAIKVRDALGPMKIETSPGNKGSVSLCMIVKNEEQHLGKCLMSVKPVVDEMIVVDTGSTDRTMDIARAFGARVYDFKWTNDFSEARNFSISKASGDWILVMDADEVISPTDYDSLRKIVRRSSPKSAAYLFETRNYTVLVNTVGWVPNNGRYEEEQAGTGWHPSNKVRLFSNDSRIKFENPVHELVEPSLERLNIRLRKASIPVHHYGKLSIDKVVSKGEGYYLLGKTKLKGKADDVQSLTELAVQALELGKYEDAVELWQRVIEIRPDSTRALLNIGGAFLELGRYEDALRASKKAMALDSNVKEAVLNYSSCELFIGDVEKSVSALETLVCKEPEYPSAIGMLSTAYFILGEKEKGLKYIDKIKKMGFNPSDYLYKRAKQFISAGKTDYAILLLEIATESNNANRDVISLLSECYRTYGTVVGNVAIQSKNLELISSPEIRQ
ncbi:MAG: tetratricopeptide repeat protein, partial [Bacteroidetes bacterium]|nr:tetratricopeptide repeat protein [Bacteroidota bacterium]